MGAHIQRVIVALGVLALAAVPAFAVGPDGALDAVWQVQLSHPSLGVSTVFVSAHQNDGFLSRGFNVALIVLDDDGSWVYSLATRAGSTVQGNVFDPRCTLFDPSCTLLGTFSFTLTSPTTLSGQARIQGVSFSLTGSKLF